MPHSTRSSAASAPCRLEWRPSRWLTLALWAMGALAACAVLASEMPTAVAWPLAIAALAYGAWRGRQEARRPASAFVFGASGSAQRDGAGLEAVVLRWRGPLAFLAWREDGRRRHAVWWPDTLPAHARRELRLAVPEGRAAPADASVAP